MSAGRDPGVIPEIRFCVATAEGPVRVDVVGLVREPKSGQLLAVHQSVSRPILWTASAWSGFAVGFGDSKVRAARAALLRAASFADTGGDFAALVRSRPGVENPPTPPLRREWFLLPEQRKAFDESRGVPS